METQLQLRDLIESPNLRDHFRRHFRPFLHYLEEEEPELAKHTGYMRKMHKHILKIIERLETCGFERLITLAHGDAKPNNFLFRRIEIDLEGLECEGIEPILVDWQGGFLGSAANDLMWALFPFLEHSRGLLPTAMEYYYDQVAREKSPVAAATGFVAGVAVDMDTLIFLLCLYGSIFIVVAAALGADDESVNPNNLAESSRCSCATFSRPSAFLPPSLACPSPTSRPSPRC